MAEPAKTAHQPDAQPDAVMQPSLVAVPPEKRQPESDFPFAVTVGSVYEGPLDLLLDLIRKQDIDIYNIPIAVRGTLTF